MLVIYTSPGCASCRKAKAWLKERGLKFVEKNIFSSILRENEIRFLLSRSENGTDDLISTRSKVIKDNNVDLDSMSIKELISFIKEYPSVLKRPIIIDEKNLLIGFDSEEIEVFDKKKTASTCYGEKCPNYQLCGALKTECSGY